MKNITAEIHDTLMSSDLDENGRLDAAVRVLSALLTDLGDSVRADTVDNACALVRMLSNVPPHWPSPSREVVAGALAEANGQGEGTVMGFCPSTRQPFTIVFNAQGDPVRFSVGRPRTATEQAEAERHATRAVFRQGGLKVVDDDPVH